MYKVPQPFFLVFPLRVLALEAGREAGTRPEICLCKYCALFAPHSFHEEPLLL